MAKTLEQAIIQGVIKGWIVKTMKGNASMLSGYKTYIIAALMLILAGLNLVGIDVPGVPPIDLGTAVMAALGLISGRLGARADAAKALLASNANALPTSVSEAKSVVKNVAKN